ncbi:SusC/RagA family TonB-linked outer membrane protein [Dyadobacter psychrotolerans]|uniref:TonB-dependent receptor n=1 Tax=Dyadobacter psychrotolerans TaxID=2541721 RepID=A0A4R5DRK2_9BACT|nr:TonB-dependent receptor [Dyadobacter psychrotolerans]TDE14860.1 TonB-dependent receptor [Dyadobacter psychrotolerans]
MSKKLHLITCLILLTCLQHQHVICAQTFALSAPQQTQQIITVKKIGLSQALNTLSTRHKLIFEFNDNALAGKAVDLADVERKEKIEEKLKRLLLPNNLLFERSGKNSFLIYPKSSSSAEPAGGQQNLPLDNTQASFQQNSTPPLSPLNAAGTQTARTKNADISLTGLVRDEKGEGLPGVSIVVAGTPNGTTTNADGKFALNVADKSAKLVFSYVGYLSQEITVANQTNISVTLLNDSKALDEVVVVGYGTVRKSDLTGSVSKITADKVNERSISSVEQMLQGQVSGVQITQNTGAPGGGITFNIRGATSVSGSNQPLIVIDGYPVDSDNGSVKMSGGSQSGYLSELPSDNALANLNPADIESVEILKDASATAIYGSRGSNGVVLITTKRGKSGRDRIEYSFRYDISKLPKKIPVLNTSDYIKYSNEAYLRSGQDSVYKSAAIAELEKTNTDWQDLVYQTAITQNHQLSLSGGMEKMKYAIQLGYLGQEGIIKNSKFDRGSIRINLDREFSKNFKMGLSMSGSMSKNKAAMQSSNRDDVSTSVVHGALRSRPMVTPFTAEDELDQSYQGNPLTLVNLADDQNRVTTVLANIFAEYTLLKGLSFRLNGGVNNSSSQRDFYHPRGTTLGNLEGGYAYRGNLGSFNYLTEYTLNLNRTFYKKHRFNAVAGYTWQEWNRRSFGLSALNFPNDNQLYYNFAGANSISKPVTSTQEWALSSFLGRVNYSFDNKYLFTLTGRADGSTRLAAGNKWAFFPSVAVGWNLHNENFIKAFSFVSELKLRASYGLSGNQAIAVGATKATLATTNTVVDQSVQTGYVQSNMANDKLHWETTKQGNVGLDMSFFNNKLDFEFNYYKKNSVDLLIALVIPPSNGFTRYNTNLGSVENKGYEFDLGLKPLSGSLQWDVSANLSINRNKIVNLGSVESFVGTAFLAIGGQSLHIAQVGSPIGSFYGYRINGIYQNQEQIDNGPKDSSTPTPGSFKYQDINSDGSITAEDREIIGNPYPDFIFGLTNNLTWKGLTMSVFVQGSIGQDVINANRFYLDALARGNQSNVSQQAYDNRWTGEGTSNYYPAPSTSATPFNSRFTDFIVEDATFVRLKNITLSYGFPPASIRRIRNLKLFVSVSNLLTLTKYKGYDPEINSRADNSMMPGVDNGSIPQYRTLSAGINIGF